MKLIPRFKSLIFFLSLASDKEDIDCTLQRSDVTLPSPSVISFVAELLDGCELYPIKVRFEPVVTVDPAFFPIAVLLLLVLLPKAPNPIAVLSLPESL